MNRHDLNASIADLDSKIIDLNRRIVEEVDCLVTPFGSDAPEIVINHLLAHWLKTLRPDMADEVELDFTRSALHTAITICRLSHFVAQYIELEKMRDGLRKEVSGE